jgi:predicted dehydrogenase
MKEKLIDTEFTRRDFIKATGVTTAGLVANSMIEDAKAAAPAIDTKGRILGANDRIRYGFVGVGGMGSGHLRIIKGFAETENVEAVAVCDVFEKRCRAARERAGIAENQAFGDYRKVIENKEIDVVVIATPDHWHARVALDAMDAGKHCYIEKPMTRTFDEGIKVWKKARETRCHVQVGAHGTSDPKWHKVREIIQSGRIGRVLWAQASYCRNNRKGEWNYDLDPDATETTIDWKSWLGNARKRPFSAERYFRWRKYWDYANGIIGDLWPHRLYPFMLALGINEFPKTVSCLGGILCDTDKGNGEPRDVADTTMLTVQFPSGAMIVIAGCTVNERGLEDVIRGQKANLLCGGLKVQVQPERPFVDEIEAKDETPPDSGENHTKHQKNFIDSLRANRPPNCDIEMGIRGQAIVSMAEQSYRKGKTMHFDSRRMKVES